MTDVHLDRLLRPSFKYGKDLKLTDGVAELHQVVRLEAQKRLHGVLDEYNSEDIPHKIELTIRRIARELDFIERVDDVNVVYKQNATEKQTGYEVSIKYQAADNYQFYIDRA
jgi:hypothetical protein